MMRQAYAAGCEILSYQQEETIEASILAEAVKMSKYRKRKVAGLSRSI